MAFSFVVVADSHFHPEDGDSQSAYASDAVHNDRNRAVAAWIARVNPAFVIHLGDVPHPIPGVAGHEEALAVARATYGDAVHVVPGNHDVGDKPHPWAPAPSVSDAKHACFRRWWGEPYRALSHEGCRFLLLDTPVMNSGLPIEDEQWTWLEHQLASARGQRIFVFTHYPPFLLDPGEPAHYDNLAEPARGRLLALFEEHRVSAVFSGHVHRFFWARHRGTDFWILPSTAFARPEYSELDRVGPGPEFGRDDAHKLGCLLVRVDDGLDVHPVRMPPEEPSVPAIQALGVSLRHAWDQALDVPCGNLDEFARKWARNDLVLWWLLALGIRRVRVPLGDLARPATAARMADLATMGFRFTVFSAGLPGPADEALAAHPAVEAWEVVIPRARLGAAVPGVLSTVGSRPKGGYYSHFHEHGFGLDEEPPAARAVWRVPPDADVRVSVARLAERGVGQHAHVELPRQGEGASFDDDDAIATRVVAAARAATEFPTVRVFLDTFVDHDRGYFPRHGVLDRRSNPRAAAEALWRLARGVEP